MFDFNSSIQFYLKFQTSAPGGYRVENVSTYMRALRALFHTSTWLGVTLSVLCTVGL